MAFLAFLENISPSWRNLTSPESFLLVLRTQIWHVLETRAYEKPREITKEHVWFFVSPFNHSALHIEHLKQEYGDIGHLKIGLSAKDMLTNI